MLNKTQKENLKVLRDFLDKNRESVSLDMGTFCALVDEETGDYIDELALSDFMRNRTMSDNATSCGASMCMLGWAATVFKDKIRLDDEGRVMDDWQDIGMSLFGVHNTSCQIGQYLFSSDWAEFEETNTVDFALERIDNVLAAETEEDYGVLEESFLEFIDS